MAKKTVRDLEVSNKTVLVRVDFNVPIKGGKITDDTRIVKALPTINYLLENNAKVVLVCKQENLHKIKKEILNLS